MTGFAATEEPIVPFAEPRQLASLGGLRCERIINRLLVQRLLRAWHSTHGPRVGWRVAFALYDGSEILGVSIWGFPTARLEDNSGRTLEHYRMALSPSAPKNAASWFIARNREWVRRELPAVSRLITYLDETVHSGVTYRADNWRRVPCDPRGKPWKPYRNAEGRLLRRTSRPHGRRAKFEREP